MLGEEGLPLECNRMRNPLVNDFLFLLLLQLLIIYEPKTGINGGELKAFVVTFHDLDVDH